MGGVKVKSSLGRFKKKMSYFSNIDLDDLCDAVAKEGVEVAKQNYADPVVGVSQDDLNGIRVYAEKAQGGTAKVVASGDKIAYIEYGVGEYARGTYKGKLPTEPISFESPKNFQQTTNGWEYYYDNSKTKKEVNGVKGWFTKIDGERKFLTGHSAGNQMFMTATHLKKNKIEIVRNALKAKEM